MSDFRNYLNSYEFKTVLPGSKEEIRFKPITTAQLKKLLIYENEEDISVIEDVLDNLISSSIENDDFNINDLFIQDRFFLLLEIRKQTIGSMYKFKTVCEKCGSQNLNTIDLSSLKIKEFNKNFSENIIQINDKVGIKLKYIRRQDQKEAYKRAQNIKSKNETEKLTEIAINTHASYISKIITPDGENSNLSFEDKVYIIENIPTDKYMEINDYIENNDFGVDFTYELICNKCKNKEKRNIPLEDFFF